VYQELTGDGVPYAGYGRDLSEGQADFTTILAQAPSARPFALHAQKLPARHPDYSER
jgi:hypothetical protein